MNQLSNIIIKYSISLTILIALFVLLVVMVVRIEYAGEAEAAYTIDQSLRFNDDDSAYLSRTPSSEGNRKTWTWSAWIKRANLGTYQRLISQGPNGGSDTNYFSIDIISTDKIAFAGYNTVFRRTSAVYRDPSAWMHIVVVVDTTQSTADDRIKLYVNGEQVTSFEVTNNPTQNADTGMNSTYAAAIGSNSFTSVYYVDGYMSDVHLVDGQALTPSSFGETDTNGYWRPKEYSGSYGTNGFHLDFANSSDLGNDVSGNNNDWTSNNLDATDQVIDTPTNGFATLNPLNKPSQPIISNGLLDVSAGTYGSNFPKTQGTFLIPTSGKYYYEAQAQLLAGGGNAVYVGFDYATNTPSNNEAPDFYYSYSIFDGSISDDEYIRVAADIGNGLIWYGDSEGWENGDPSVGSGGASFNNEFELVPALSSAVNSGNTNRSGAYANFGQNAQSGLTYYSAAGGYFKYEPPSGFKALSTANLPTPAVDVPKKYFDAITYTGTGAAQSIDTEPATVTTFTSSGNWIAPPGVSSVEVLVVAGGGGGGSSKVGEGGSGGGGAGGLQYDASFPVNPGETISVTVGAGGAGGAASAAAQGGDGSNSVFGTITATGGGGGGGGDNLEQAPCTSGSCIGSSGGSGGGAGFYSTSPGSGTAGEGNDGGSGAVGHNGGAGGGGAGAVGGNTSAVGIGGDGGDGLEYSISGSATYYAGGGGGGGYSGYEGAGGNGGGGSGHEGADGDDGTVNTGGGGGGTYAAGGKGGDGGSGVVIVKYTPVVSGFSFTPALTWLKDRDATNDHGLFDSVRGVGEWLASNLTQAETTDSDTLTAFNADGFSLGADTKFNTSGNNYISWNWKESVDSGFDIVTYTGNGTNRTISHSLSAAPNFMIIKDRSGTNDWAVYHAENTSAPETDYLLLNSTTATADDNTYWNDTAPTTSTFSVGTNVDVNTNTNNYIAYLFAEKDGFSKFGSYTGNGSTDGPFVYTGFKPRYLLLKRSSGGVGNWVVKDSVRTTYNPSDADIFLDLSSAEGSPAGAPIDLLSNGFKLRNAGTGYNTSGSDYVYAAFAETPFKYSAASAAGASAGGATFLIGIPF